VGEHARRVQERLRERLREHAGEWQSEERVAGTPVDLVGCSGDPSSDGPLALVELEWRRADPADNAAKLFRHLADDAVAVDTDEVHVVQLFTAYYDLASGGRSSKRLNAEFVGRAAADSLDRVTYRAVDLAIDPPKRGGELPAGWQRAVDAAAERVKRL
jgi:hypothetical protein